MFYISGLLYII